jgi:flagellar basal-body rod modification protein FlgD
MAVSPISSTGSTTTASEKSAALNSSFRDADFMKILMSEITHQDPLKPQDTAQIVDSMQKLQQLANSRYEKQRDDERWARDLVGGSVTVQQSSFTGDDLKALKDKGLDPDVGYQTVSGVVQSFRVVGEQIWVKVGGKDYQLDNVKQIDPPKTDGGDLAGMAGMLGRKVTWAAEGDSASGAGVVSSLSLGDAGQVLLGIGGAQIPLSRVRGISTT